MSKLLYSSPNSNLYISNSHDLLMKIDINTPEFQREIIADKVQEISNELQINPYLLEMYNPIILGELYGKNYVIDGQHRLMALNQLLGFDQVVNCLYQVIKCKSHDEIIRHFISINKNTPLENFYKNLSQDKAGKILEIKKAIKVWITSEYKDYISSNANPNLPNISIDKFLEFLISYIEEESLEDWFYGMEVKEIITKLKETNQLFHNWFLIIPKHHEMYNKKIEKKKARSPGFTLGFPINWLDVFAGRDLPKMIEKPKRKKFNKVQREQIWKHYIGDSMNGKCYCCGRDISFTTYEIGHVHPVAMGGDDEIENVRVICGLCNRSMGTQNLEEFKSSLLDPK
jgi:hypothetical protein